MKAKNYGIESNAQRLIFLKQCFDCLVNFGLEKVSMREFCKATGLSPSSLYGRFKSKDELIIDAVYYGLESVTKELFWLASTKLTNAKDLSNAVLQNVDLRKRRIRLIYQVVASPRYGELFRRKAKRILEIYNTYVELFSEHFKCSSQVLMPYVYLFVAGIREYVIWNDREKIEIELNEIYSDVMKKIRSLEKK